MKETANTKNRRQSLGDMGEELAAQHLSALGLVLLERNFHHGKKGEIDIIALEPEPDSDSEKDCLVFIEVKTRRFDSPTSAFEHTGQLAVDRRKRQKIMSSAFAYLSSARERLSTLTTWGKGRMPMRFDLILIDIALTRSKLNSIIDAQDQPALAEHCHIQHFKELF